VDEDLYLSTKLLILEEHQQEQPLRLYHHQFHHLGIWTIRQEVLQQGAKLPFFQELLLHHLSLLHLNLG